ncbi:MAG: flagellin, partial [Clostridia bacterium]|nr:flagellin [Clostridia bacterium]
SISRDNVTNAESTIRDADMAKEMMNYTRNNILLQTSQSMLAQANQNSSAVLSLLQ